MMNYLVYQNRKIDLGKVEVSFIASKDDRPIKKNWFSSMTLNWSLNSTVGLSIPVLHLNGTCTARVVATGLSEGPQKDSRWQNDPSLSQSIPKSWIALSSVAFSTTEKKEPESVMVQGF